VRGQRRARVPLVFVYFVSIHTVVTQVRDRSLGPLGAVGTLSEKNYSTGLLSSRPEGKNGLTLHIIHVYYIIVHVHPRKTGPWPRVSARA